MIDIEIIKKYNKSKIIGKRIFKFDQVDSTNLEALRMIDSSIAQHGDVIIAKSQLSGKGQQDNVWQSPEGGLYISIITASRVNELSNLITFMTGISCIKAIKNITGITPNLKWVNDIIFEGNKLGGILTQSLTRGNVSTNISGIGINVNNLNVHTDNSNYKAVSLTEISGNNIDINVLISEICMKFEKYFSVYQQKPEEIVSNWIDCSNIVDRKILFVDNGSEIQGIITGVNNSGYLSVKANDRNYILTSTKYIKSCLF